ncbi:THO complex subunit 2, partial [Tulasnella sp. 427]
MGSESIPSIPLMNEIVQHCFLPRALMSPMDAEYCATFIRSIHKNGTPGFSTLACYDRLIGDQLAPFITSCSDREAINFSKFLRHILADFTRWLKPEVYKKEQATKSGEYFPGFVKKVTSLVKPTFKADDLLNSNEIGTWVQKLHKKILKAAIICLESNEYRPVKNIFLVLNEILPQFPKKIVSPALGITLQPAVKAYLNDDRDDIKVLATGYYNKLELDKAHWLPDIPAPPTNATVTPAPSPAPVETPAPSASQPLASSASRSTMGPGPEPTVPSASQHSITGLPAKPQSLGRTSSANNTHLQPGLSANPAGSRTTTVAAAGGPSASTSHRPTERPEFIPRGKTGVPASNASPGPGPTGQDAKVSQAPTPSGPTPSARVSPSVSSLPAKPKDLPARPDSRTDITHSPRPNRRNDDVSTRGGQPMPPPVAPSSKPTAQDLRSSARAVPTGRDEGDDRPSRAPRRNSPVSSRPATRNPSSDSRTSDPARTDRGSTARDRGDRTSKRDREQESDREQDLGIDAVIGTGTGKGKRSAIVIAKEIATRTRIEKGSVTKVEEIVTATDAKESLEKNATVTVAPSHPRRGEVVGRKIESITPLLVTSPLVFDLPSTTVPINVAVKKSRMKVLPSAFERTDEIVHALRRGKPLETPMVETSARPNVLGLLTDVIDIEEMKKGAQRRRTGGKETRATVNATETRIAILEMETGAKKGERTSEAGGMQVVRARENANGPMRQTARSGTERS